MWHSRMLRHRKGALAAALGLALASLPIASLLRDEAPPAPDRVVQFEALAARAESPAIVTPLEAALPPAGPSQGEPPATDAPPAPEAVSPAPVPPEPVVTPAPAFEQLAVVDPLTRTEATPIAFPDLPAVETVAAAASPEADVPVYVPGSIGKAKRQWAGGDGTDDRGGLRRTIIVGGGGHCPVPGRVIPPYKTTRPARPL